MDLNNDAASGGSEQSPITQSPIAIMPAPAGDSPMDAREAARSLVAWRRDRDQQRNKSKDQPQFRAVGAEDAAPYGPAQESTPAPAGDDAGEPQALPGETENADPAMADPRPEAGAE